MRIRPRAAPTSTGKRSRGAGGTLVILMGAGHVADIATRLQAGGRPASTPAAAIRWGTAAAATHDSHHARRRRRRGDRIAVGHRGRRGRGPRARPGSSAGPLLGRRVVVTRAREQASELRARLEAAGCRRDRAARRSASSRSDSRCPRSSSTSGSCSRRPTGSTPSSTAASLQPVSMRVRSHGLRVAVHRSGHRARARGARHHAPTWYRRASSPSRCSTRSRVAGTPGRRVSARAGRDRARRAARRTARARLPRRRAPGVPHGVGRAVDAGDLEVVRCRRRSTRSRSRRRRPLSNFVDMIGGPRTALGARGAAERGCGRRSVRSIGPITSTLRARGLRVDAEADPHDIDGLVAAVRRRSRPHPLTGSLVPCFPEHRLRRLRRTQALRRLIAERRVSVDDLVAPLFVKEGIDDAEPVPSMPGRRPAHAQDAAQGSARARRSRRARGDVVRRAGAQGRTRIAAPTTPTASCSSHCETLRDEVGDAMVLMADDCLDEYTDHGHCGLLTTTVRSTTTRRSSATRRIALAQAAAGADVIAPSGMMDGQVGAIRRALDGSGHTDDRDPRLRGEVRVGAVRTVPRRGRVRAELRRPHQLPDARRPTRARRSTRCGSTSARAPTW